MIEDIDKVTKERFKIDISNYSLTTEINLTPKDIVWGAAGGAAFDYYYSGIQIPLGTILGIAASIIDIKASRTISFEPAKDKKKLSYLANAYKAKILNK